MSDELKKRVRLTPQERIELFTVMQQWSRNQELQAQKITEWFEARSASFAEKMLREVCTMQCGACAEGLPIAPRLKHKPHITWHRDEGGLYVRCTADAMRRRFGLTE